MPNICNANVFIKGRKDAVDKFIKILKENYNYNEGSTWKDAPHFFRIFRAYDEETLQEYGMTKLTMIQIECAWSVHCCMFPGAYTYYDDFAKKIEPRRENESAEEYDEYIKTQHRKMKNATNIFDITRELNLMVEIVSAETEGVFFQEHYVIDSGKLIFEECFNIVDLWPSNYDEYLEYKEKYNLDMNINNNAELEKYLDDNGGIRPFGELMWDAEYIYDHSPYDNMIKQPMCSIVDKSKPHIKSKLF